MTGGGFERHPLANYFFDGIRELAFWFSSGKRDQTFRLVLALLSALTVSLTVVQIEKYLKNIIRLPLSYRLLLLVFFSLFSTSILLSFTPETYTYTLFFLATFNYYCALKIRRREKLSAGSITFATVSLGGLTITNAAKAFLPLLFEKNLFSSFKNALHGLYRGIVAVALFVFLYLYRVQFDYLRIFSKTTEQYEKFSQPKVTPIWEMIVSWFFGGNVLFSSFILRDYHNQKGFEYQALFMEVYSGIGPYLFTAALALVLLWAVVENWKNPLLQILFCSFLLDVVIHCVLKFGLHTAYIYGGHFVFVFPLMLGWLFFKLRYKPLVLTPLWVGLIVMTVYLALNNGYRIMEFLRFLELYHKA